MLVSAGPKPFTHLHSCHQAWGCLHTVLACSVLRELGCCAGPGSAGAVRDCWARVGRTPTPRCWLDPSSCAAALWSDPLCDQRQKARAAQHCTQTKRRQALKLSL